MIRHFTQKYVTVGILFTPIDADMTLTPVGADTGRFQTFVRLLCRFYDPSTQVILII
jgi:ABC-type transport system involved in Fe-S cluster assembly fused permease/ATPase subunit